MVWVSKSAALAGVAFLAASAEAHMKMKTPTPYGVSTLDNSPLLPDGSDFPCKQRPGVYNAEGANNFAAIGESQTLSFLGSAVHGGGSCQVSLTTDLQPNKNSKWMVILSIEGGCPISAPGNLPADPEGTGASTFQFTIPDGIAPGEYTLAWTWFNKIGNREMYMNCAPMTVLASKKRYAPPAPKAKRQSSFPDPAVLERRVSRRQTSFLDIFVAREARGEDVSKATIPNKRANTFLDLAVSKRQTSFPEMFVANLASINDCSTPESFDYNFPNPGAVVQSAGTGPFTQLACGAGGGNNTPQQPTASVPSAGGNTATATSNAGGPPPSVPTYGGGGSGPPAGVSGGDSGQYTPGGNDGQYGQGGIMVTVTAGNFASGAASATSGFQVIPVQTSAPAIPTSTSSTPDTSSGSSSAVGALTGPCENEGYWLCLGDERSYQRCASGVWSTVMPLNTGMKCAPGISAEFNESPGKAKSKRWSALQWFA